jgi:hypothetical protein
MEQLESAVRAVDIKLDEMALARLDEIFPGYKTSPEDYACVGTQPRTARTSQRRAGCARPIDVGAW